MTLTKVATEVLRLDRYVTSGSSLKQRLLSEPIEQACNILGIRAVDLGCANTKLYMSRIAYHYGYMPETAEGGWRALPMFDKPFDAGPRFEWTSVLIRYVREVLGNPLRRPPVVELAWRMDTTEGRLRGIIRRNRIILGPNVVGGNSEDLCLDVSNAGRC